MLIAYIQLNAFLSKGDYRVYGVLTSSDGGRSKTSVYNGSLAECRTIAAAFVAVGYSLTVVRE